jgi:two-component system chemotaxis response regulator CheY
MVPLNMTTAIVIDDSAVARRSIRPLLEAAGCRVVAEGASGDDVLGLYEQHRPTLITMDIVMPGKDGVTAATELLKLHPQAIVIMCTSLTSREKILACQKAGVAHYLLKPFQPEKTVQVIRYVLGRAAERALKAAGTPAPMRTEGGA